MSFSRAIPVTVLIRNFAVVYTETGGLILIWTLSTEIPTKTAHYKRAQLTI